jgi:colanic acid biosynthesis glycosyl transferase WcaI
MRVLLLNMYFPPDTSATAKMIATVAAALSAAHDVTVLCGRPSYDPTERRVWRLWQTERINERLRIIRVGSTDHPRMQMNRRVLNYLTYVMLAVPRALPVPCDVVLTMTDPPFAGIVGAVVALLKGKPYVYNIRDMYPDMATGGSIVAPGFLSRVWERLHRWALRRASRVIVLGEDMRARIIAKGVDQGRVKIVRDGTDIIPADSPSPLDPEVIRAIRGDFRFIALHAGNLGFYGAWQTLLAAARVLSNNGVGFVFVGDGAQRAQLEAAASGSENVRFLPFFPASKILSVLAAGDIHIVTVKRGLEGVVVPSKMYGILAAGRPIVAVAPAESDAATLALRQGFGVAADPDKPEELVAALRALMNEPERISALGAAARAASFDYDRVNELRKFVEIIEEAARA